MGWWATKPLQLCFLTCLRSYPQPTQDRRRERSMYGWQTGTSNVSKAAFQEKLVYRARETGVTEEGAG